VVKYLGSFPSVEGWHTSAGVVKDSGLFPSGEGWHASAGVVKDSGCRELRKIINIRTVTSEDIPRILEIEQESFTPPWSVETFLNELDRDDSLFTVAIQDNEIVGFSITRQMADEAELQNIAVIKTHQRQGIADALVNSVLDWAKKQEIQAIYLEVRESNDSAIALYTKHGFKPIGLRRDYYDQPTENAVIMARRI
jgi:ribosomal-protein-alanine N-acetyltransferase